MNEPGSEQKLTVAVDTWALGTSARNQGIHVYARHLLAHFREIASRYPVVIRPYTCAQAENDANLLSAATGFAPRQTGLLRFSRLWRYGGACALARVQKPDLVFSPQCNTLYFGSRVAMVVTIHDLIPVLLPCPSKRIAQTLKLLTWAAARYSHAIITDSESSKKDLINVYGVPESKVSVVYLGYDSTIFNSVPLDPERQKILLERLGIRKAYILHHGIVQPRKNLKRLIEAYRKMLARNRNLDIDLVLAGATGWGSEVVVTAAENSAGLPGHVLLPGPVSDSDLSLLVKGASLAVVPSLYEGFCLPMVESMACGVPTVASNASCLPEVSGGVLKYFDPYSVEEMSACMESVLENQDLSGKLAARGRQKALSYDWRRCAEQTLAVLISAGESL
ncbi:MAG TPA: glycosyltransferase family 1 protein [Verrucomicrobiae bacterium]|nr:glycosyltransferase family 1 protein [Verrucomicrobiae bacterium]